VVLGVEKDILEELREGQRSSLSGAELGHLRGSYAEEEVEEYQRHLEALGSVVEAEVEDEEEVWKTEEVEVWKTKQSCLGLLSVSQEERKLCSI